MGSMGEFRHNYGVDQASLGTATNWTAEKLGSRLNLKDADRIGLELC